MATIPIYNPVVPFLGQIPGGFRPSLMIRIKAKINSRWGRCNIDFINSPALSIGQDVIFHLSVRRDEKCLVRNAFINKRWGEEERYGKITVKLSDPFEIIILAEMEFYKIAINGIHIGVFRHRLPLHMVNFINVTGDCTVDHILLEQDLQAAQQYPIGIGHIVGSVHAVQSHPIRYINQSPVTITSVTASTPSNPPVSVQYDPPPPYNPSAPPSNTWMNTSFLRIEQRPGQIVFKTNNGTSTNTIRF